MSEDDLLKIRNFGDKSLQELREKLAERGISYNTRGATMMATADDFFPSSLPSPVAEDGLETDEFLDDPDLDADADEDLDDDSYDEEDS
jgi:hypothetical protein